VDPLDLEVSEFCKVGEFQVTALGHPDSDGSIVVNDPCVKLVWERGKETLDMSAVERELLLSMPENKERRFDCRFPCNDPIAMRFNSFGWGWGSMEQFNMFPELDGLSIVVRDGVEVGKNMVEVDGVATE
jgi:hypothetical protein